MTTAQENILAKRISMINNVDAVTGQVTFLVGSKKSVITAHKIFLTTASEVFEAMFSKNFETEEKIVVKDVEEDAFMQVD
jgi:BTB/POZ domain